MGIVRRHIRTEVDWESIEKLERIGLDEISLKKGHKDFVTIVSAYIEGSVQLLAVLEGRLDGNRLSSNYSRGFKKDR